MKHPKIQIKNKINEQKEVKIFFKKALFIVLNTDNLTLCTLQTASDIK